MRPALTAVFVLAAGLLGGATVFLLSGGGDDGATRTVIVDELPRGEVANEPVRNTPAADGRFNPAAVYGRRAGGVVTIYAVFSEDSASNHAAQGSGFVASARGHVLTSAHVVTETPEARTEDASPPTRKARRVYVQFADGDRVPAKLVGYDLFTDVGVLRVDPSLHPLEPIPLGDSSAVRVGEPVAAIGSPYGNENSLSVGVVSATRRSLDTLATRFRLAGAIQTDAAITHGNSGGPLLDARGRAIGINAQIRSNTGEGEGIGFAIPINAARRSLRELVAHGRVSYPYLGIRTDDMTPSLARRFGYTARRGALVAVVESGTPASRAGLRGGGEVERFNGLEVRPGGDLIVAIAGRPVSRADDVSTLLIERHSAGETVVFTVERDGKRRTVRVELAERP